MSLIHSTGYIYSKTQSVTVSARSKGQELNRTPMFPTRLCELTSGLRIFSLLPDHMTHRAYCFTLQSNENLIYSSNKKEIHIILQLLSPHTQKKDQKAWLINLIKGNFPKMKINIS